MPGFDTEIARMAERLLIKGRPIDYHTGSRSVCSAACLAASMQAKVWSTALLIAAQAMSSPPAVSCKNELMPPRLLVEEMHGIRVCVTKEDAGCQGCSQNTAGVLHNSSLAGTLFDWSAGGVRTVCWLDHPQPLWQVMDRLHPAFW